MTKRKLIIKKITAFLAVLVIVSVSVMFAIPAYAVSGTTTVFFDDERGGSFTTGSSVSITFNSYDMVRVSSSGSGNVSYMDLVGDGVYFYIITDTTSNSTVDSGYMGYIDGVFNGTYSHSTTASHNYEIEIYYVGYCITFNSNGGSSILSVYSTVVPAISGVSMGNEFIPTRSGYSFSGWYSNSALTQQSFSPGMTLSGPITLYAKWTSTSGYSVEFNSNGGSSISSLSNVFALPSDLYTNPAYIPTKSGYIFDGWYTQNLNIRYSEGSSIDSNTILYAKWTEYVPDTYTVTFNSNGGSSVSNLSGVTSLPNDLYTNSSYIPTNSGYTFDGWYDQSLTTRYQAGASISANTTLYAKWTLTGFTIYFNTNGGNYISPIYVDSIPDDLPRPVRVGYIFDGWYYDENFISSVVAGDGRSESVWIYAKWEALPSGGSYQDGYNNAQNDNSTLKTIINVSWSAFYDSFVDFTSRTTIGGISLISILITLIVIVLLFIVAKLFLG